MEVIIGNVYRNKKHGTLYRAIGFTRHSETLEILVNYERLESKERTDMPWSRPIELFKEKFESYSAEVFWDSFGYCRHCGRKVEFDYILNIIYCNGCDRKTQLIR